MTDTRPADLLYGHFGEPRYDSEAQEWRFPRHHGDPLRMEPLGPIVHAIQSTQPSISEDWGAVQRADATRDFLKFYPELAPGVYGLPSSVFRRKEESRLTSNIFIPTFTQVSEAIIDVSRGCDPVGSELLAMGEMVSFTNKLPSRTKRKVLAVAAGYAGELVRLIALTKEELRWPSDHEVRVNTLTAKKCEEGWWAGTGLIQQLVFRDSASQMSSLLAVRHDGGISILQPVLRQAPVVPSNADGPIKCLPSSRIDANHLVTLTTGEMEGFPATDVSFNPWKHLEFATVDETGHWSLWIIQPQVKGKGIWAISKFAAGDASNENEPKVIQRQAILDGWGKVIWIGNVDSILVASRKSLVLLDFALEKPRLAVPDIGVSNSADWIFDIKVNPVYPDHVFVLTSSRLLWLKLLPAGKRQEEDASILLSWIHFRDPQDLSLSLNPVRVGEGVDVFNETVMVLLYSQLNDLVTIFTFQYHEAIDHAVSVRDPYPLILPSCPSPSSQRLKASRRNRFSSNARCLRLHPILPGDKTQEDERLNERSRLFQLIVLHTDLALTEQIYVQSRTQAPMNVEPPIRSRRELPKSSIKIMDDFIVPDNVQDDWEDTTVQAPNHSQLPIGHGSDDDKESSHTIDMRWLMQDISNDGINASGNRCLQLTAVPLADGLETVYAAVEAKLNETSPGMDTLLDLTSAQISIKDVDEATDTLSQLVHTICRKPSEPAESKSAVSLLAASTLTPTLRGMLDLENSSSIKYSDIYDSLVGSFISPLDQATPSRIRIALDRQLRNIAVQVYLASHVLRVRSEDASNDTATLEDDSTHDALTLPMRRKTSSSAYPVKPGISTPHISTPPASSPTLTQDAGFHTSLPTPDPTTPSHRSPSSHRPATASPAASAAPEAEDPPSQRLRTLTEMTPQPILPSKLSNILAHWTVGADPAGYDWYAAQRQQVSGPSVEPETPAQATRRLKAEKRARKRARLDGDLGDASSQMHTQTLPPETVMRDPKGPEVSRGSYLPSSIPPVASTIEGPGVSSSQLEPGSSQLGTLAASVSASAGAGIAGKKDGETMTEKKERKKEKKKPRKAGF